MVSVAGWLPFVRASAAGWIPVARHPIEQSESISGSGQRTGSEERVRLNVSGQRFEAFSRTLARFPDTLLGSDERDYFYDEARDEYFFDRNPAIFRRVLSYYRSGRLHYPRDECVAEFNEELAFFGIRAADALPECCAEDYREHSRDLADRLSVAMQAETELTAGSEATKTPTPPTLRGRLWQGFENPHSSTWALVFYYITGFFIIVSVMTNIIETVPCGAPDPTSVEGRSLTCGERFDIQLFCVDTACVIIFTLEYLVRLYAAPNRLKQVHAVF